MRARVGDRIFVAGTAADGPLQDGEVLDTGGPDGSPPFLVRWSDGRIELFSPGPESFVVLGTLHPGDPARPASADEPAAGVLG
jgi:hypothetical protein